MFRLRTTIRLAALACFMASGARASDQAASERTDYDRPRAILHVDLGPADTVPPQNKEVRCSYYRTFMVKEIDEREIGAAQLSLLPIPQGGAAPPCQKENLPGERVIDASAWSGYFDGAKGEFAVFSAEDGVHGGLGFAVVRPPDAKILYSAVAKGPLRFSAAADGRTLLAFQAVRAGPCSVALKGAACAKLIAKQTGIAAPDVAICKTGYAEAKRADAKAWCESNKPTDPGCAEAHLRTMSDWDRSPTVVAYGMQVTLGPLGAAEHPTGAPSACWPAE